MTDADFQYTYTPLEKPVRVTEQEWPDGTVPLVSISCITYNHVNFIRNAPRRLGPATGGRMTSATGST